MPLAIVGEKFDLHLRHVDTGRAFAPAAFAADAKIHGLEHLVRIDRIRSKLPGQSKSQRVCATAGQMLLVPGDTKRWTHDTGIALAASAVVVAHLDCTREPAVIRPVENRVKSCSPVAGRETEKRTVVKFWRAYDLAGIEQSFRIEGVLDLLERAQDACAEHRLDPFRAHQAVAMFAGIGALEFAHQSACFFRYGTHFFHP